MSFTLSDTGTLSQSHGVKVCIYGRSGLGKTRLFTTAPAPLILSAENGLRSLKAERLPAARIACYQDLLDAHAWLLNRQDGGRFQTIGLDSITDFANVLLEEEKRSVKDPRKAYGNMQDKIFAAIRAFRDLPSRHVVFIAQEGSILDATGAKLCSPAMPGKTASGAMPFFWDEVLQLTVGGVTPNQFVYLRCKADYANDAKDRSGMLAEMEPPHLAQLFAKIDSAPL